MRYFALIAILGLIFSFLPGQVMAKEEKKSANVHTEKIDIKNYQEKSPSDFMQGITTIAGGMEFQSKTNQNTNITVSPNKANLKIGF
ncbi:MAG: hypothetical protein ABH859_04595 [Pseudomonadota bacterium]